MRWRRESGRFLRFLVVGSVGAVVDFGIFNLLSGELHVYPVLASACSFTCAVTSNFFWNRYWTYPDSRAKAVRNQVGQFALVSLVGLFIRTPLFAGLAPVWGSVLALWHGPLPISAAQAANNLALACAVGVVLVWNFIANRLWTYNDVS
ncbi:MAG: GtrA family protein [Anaerolineales bacterium]